LKIYYKFRKVVLDVDCQTQGRSKLMIELSASEKSVILSNEKNSRELALFSCVLHTFSTKFLCGVNVMSKLSKLNNGGEGMISMYLSILIMEMNICSRRTKNV
jgi:hypothetical protein